MPKDAQLEELHTKYDQVCDRLDGYWDDVHALDEEDEFNASEIATLNGRIEELDAEADALWQQVLERSRDLVNKALGGAELESLEFDTRKCSDSPTNTCVYDIEEDPTPCLFCNTPYNLK